MKNWTNSSFDDTKSTCAHVYLAWNLIYISLCPIFMLVVCLGFQQWKQQQSRSASDILSFNMAVVEMFGVVGAFLSLLLYYGFEYDDQKAGKVLAFIAIFGQTLFHNLICTERYLAVVHPITYMRLNKKGNRTRDVCIIVVWLVCFSMAISYEFANLGFVIFSVVIIGISACVIAFFSASVLCVLIRPGPGERGGVKRHVHQSKRRAFYTMTVISLTIMLKFVTLFVTYSIFAFDGLNDVSFCLLAVSSQLLNIPSIIVGPALFLHQQVTRRKLRPTV